MKHVTYPFDTCDTCASDLLVHVLTYKVCSLI